MKQIKPSALEIEAYEMLVNNLLHVDENDIHSVCYGTSYNYLTWDGVSTRLQL